MPIKSIPFAIIRPINVPWEEAGKVLRYLQNANARIMNATMTAMYLYQQGIEAWKAEHGEYPAKAEYPKPYLYPEMRRQYPDMAAHSVAMACRAAEMKWSQTKIDCYYKQTQSLATFRSDTAIPIHPSGWRISRSSMGFVIDITALSQKSTLADDKHLRFLLYTKKVNRSFVAILIRLMNGQYKKRQILITHDRRKNKWFVSFVYEPEKTDTSTLDASRFLGVDFGVTNAFWASLSDHQEDLYSDGTEIIQYRKRIRERRKSIQRQGKFSNRSGHGVTRMLAPTEAIQHKEYRFRKNKYQCFVREILNFALKYSAGTIQIKDHRPLKPAWRCEPDDALAAMLADWAIADLCSKLKNKAEEYGINVVVINPAWTSLRCFRCGHISEYNRLQWHHFHCERCGFDTHADKNASLNLTLPNIEELIAETVASGGVIRKPKDVLESKKDAA